MAKPLTRLQIKGLQGKFKYYFSRKLSTLIVTVYDKMSMTLQLGRCWLYVPLAINYDLTTAYNWNYEDILGCDFKGVILSNASFRF